MLNIIDFKHLALFVCGFVANEKTEELITSFILMAKFWSAHNFHNIENKRKIFWFT